MKRIITVLLILVNTMVYSQQRFFTLLPGWMSQKIVVKDTNYISIGLNHTNSSFDHSFQFSNIDTFGNVNASWQFKINTAYLTSFYNRSMSFLAEDSINYVGGLIGDSYDVLLGGNPTRGSFFKFNTDFTQKIFHKEYSVDDQCATEVVIRNGSGFILGQTANLRPLFNIRTIMRSIDSVGNTKWEQSYNCGTCDMYPLQILPTVDSGYLLVVEAWRQAPKKVSEAMVIKTDSLGNEEWRTVFGDGNYYRWGNLVVPTDDGNFLITWSDGLETRNTSTGYEVNDTATLWFAKFDINGNILWEKNIKNFLNAYKVDSSFPYLMFYPQSAKMLADGNIIIGGYAIYDREYGFLLKTDQNGSPKWIRYYAPLKQSNSDASDSWLKLYDFTVTPDSGFICSGEYFSTSSVLFPNGTQQGVALKLDKYGCYTAGCEAGDTITLSTRTMDIPKKIAQPTWLLYPNPARDYLQISYRIAIPTARSFSIQLMNMSGRLVHQEVLTTESGEVQIDTRDIAAGMYWCRMVIDGRVVLVDRVVVMK